MLMHHSTRSTRLLKHLSLLIQDPDDGFITSLAALKASVEKTIDSPAKGKLLGFLSGIESMPSIGLQEHFTQNLDINPATCLNLTYHSLGDAEDRGRILADIDQVYLRAGFERTTGELPDYLPLVLEFLSVCPRAEGAELLWQHLGATGSIAEKLVELESPYQGLLELLAEHVHTITSPALEPEVNPQAAGPAGG